MKNEWIELMKTERIKWIIMNVKDELKMNKKDESKLNT